MIKTILLLLIPALLFAQQLPTMDTDFDGDGVVITSIWTNSFARCTTVQPDRKILVAGNMSRQNPTSKSFFVARYNEDGTLDSTFGENGLLFNDDDNQGWIMSLIVQDDGKILIAGKWGGAFVGRLLADGSFDTTFGNNGRYTYNSNSGFFRDMQLLPDGSILLFGSQGISNYLDANIAKFLPNGQPDVSFGTSGRIITDYGFNSIISNSLVVQNDGKFIIAGSGVVDKSYPDQNVMLLVRYNADGSPDTSFANAGVLTGDSFLKEARDIALDSNMNIIVAGERYIDTNGTITLGGSVIVRYNSNGVFDATFNNGMSLNGVNISGRSDDPSAILIDANDKIYFTGHYFTGSGTSWNRYLARFNADGTTDSTFGENGAFQSTVRNYSAESLYGNNNMAFARDGKIVIAGYVFGYLSSNITVMRLLADVTLSNDKFDTTNSVIYLNPAQSVLNIASDELFHIGYIYDLRGVVV